MGDSDSEFERFLQDDDESSVSTSPVRAPPAKANRASASSASAITSAAAVLLASSKLTGKRGKGAKVDSKNSKKKSKKSRDLSDSEEPPPSYDAKHSTYSDDADPYAFELRAPSFHVEPEEKEHKSKRKEKKTPKQEAAKKAARSVLSIEDRVAEILKRTGSTITPASIEEKEEEPPEMSTQPEVAAITQEAYLVGPVDGTTRTSHESSKLSASDSLGMESADFEVGAFARRKLELSRLSLSSLNSEKFAVNVAALENSERAPSRYQQPNERSAMSLEKSEYGDSNHSENNEYEEDFELDQTTIRDIPALENPPNDIPSSGSNHPGVSSDNGAYSASAGVFDVSSSVQHSDTFGYDDDDFEDDGDGQLKEQNAEQLADQTFLDSGKGASYHYEGDAFESQDPDIPTASNDVNAAVIMEPAPTEQKADFEALLAAKYGDFYAITEEEQQLSSIKANSEDALPEFNEHNMKEDTPTSPPPPPPPDDDEYDDDLLSFTLHTADTENVKQDSVLEPQTDPPADKSVSRAEIVEVNPTIPSEQITSIENLSVQESVTVNSAKITLDHVGASSMHAAVTKTAEIFSPSAKTGNVNRFSQIDSQVASLRFLPQPLYEKHIQGAGIELKPNEASIESTKDPQLPDLEMLFDDMEDIDEFIRQSQTLRARRHSPLKVRSSQTKEMELALRLQQAQRQIILLKNHIENIDDSSSRGDFEANRTIADIQEDTNISDQENSAEANNLLDSRSQAVSLTKYRRLQAELMTQEKLIRAFQKENEKLMQQLRHAREGAKGDLLSQNDALRRELKDAKQQLEMVMGRVDTSDAGDTHWQLRAAIDARLHAEAKALALQEDLEASQKEHNQIQSELRLELDRVKKAKIEIECRYEGVDLVKVAHESKQVQLLQKELTLKKKEYEHNISALQKKLEWYVENQRLVDEQDDELLRLRKEARLLKSEVEALRSDDLRRKNPAPSPSPAKTRQKNGYNRSPADIRRIQELESRLIEMEAAMRKRHPDSLVNLIVASKKADEESKIASMEADFESKIQALQEELEAAHEAHEKKMKSFRQQQDRLVLQYQRRIREQDIRLTERHKTPVANGLGAVRIHRQGKKEGNSETVETADRIRQFYTEKIKELERKWEAKYRALKRRSSGPQEHSFGQSTTKDYVSPLHDDAESNATPKTTAKLEELEKMLKEKEAQCEKLRVELASKNLGSAEVERIDEQHLQEHVKELETQLRASEDAREQLVRTLVALQAAINPNALSVSVPSEADTDAHIKAKIPLIREELRNELIGELRNEFIAKTEVLETQLAASTKESKVQIEELNGTRERLEKEIEKLKSEKEQLQRRISKSDELCNQLQHSADRVPLLENELDNLRRRVRIPQTPSMLQYRTLELKIETLTQKHEMREAELRVLLEQAMMSSHLERLNLERVHRSAVAAKNAEIAVFKQQLGEILDELARLQPRLENQKAEPVVASNSS